MKANKNMMAQWAAEFKKAEITWHARERYNEDAAPGSLTIEEMVKIARFAFASEGAVRFRTGSWHFVYLPREGKIVTCMHRNADRRADYSKAL